MYFIKIYNNKKYNKKARNNVNFISIISLFMFHFQFIPLIYSFSFFFFFFFSRLIQQANATQNFLWESFPPFSISLTFSLFNFINKTSNLCTNSFYYVIQLRACSTVLPSEVFKYLYCIFLIIYNASFKMFDSLKFN